MSSGGRVSSLPSLHHLACGFALDSSGERGGIIEDRPHFLIGFFGLND